MNTSKNVLIVLFLLINSLASAKTYYVATTGKDSNPGTISQPWLTWHYAFNHTSPGDTCYFRGGIYPPYSTSVGAELMDNSQDGTHSHPTCFFNYPGEVPVLDCYAMTSKNNYGIELSDCHNIYIKGLTVKNVRQLGDGYNAYGMRLTSNGSTTGHAPNNIRVENCTAHNIGGMGFNVSGVDTVYYINCDAHTCCDSLTTYDPGGSGCGFQFYDATYTGAPTSYIYVYHCRAWNNSDQGFSVVTPGLTVFDGCWSINNGNFHFAGNTIAKGSGWKFWYYTEKERNKSITQLIVRNCIAVDNEYYGFSFTGEGPEVRAHLYNNFAYRNGKLHPQGWTGGYGIYDIPKSDTIGRHDHLYYNNVSYGNYGYNGNKDLITDVVNAVANKFDISGSTVSAADFESLDATGLTGARQSDGTLPNTQFGHLAAKSELIDAGKDVGLPYFGTAPDIGWYESSSTSSTPAIPVYISSAIENATPSRLEMTYNLSLANIIPATSAFSVRVNSVARTVNSVSIAGTKVLLTLASPVVYNDVITVAYTKPATNPLETTAGGQAVTISAQSVTNNVDPVSPIYLNSSIENATPSRLEMTYNLSLANIIPATSSFSVRVNSLARTVNSVSVSGTKVLLTLASPVVYNDVITVAYTKPATNPLQTTTGGQAVTISAQSVTNNVGAVAPIYLNSSIENTTPSRLEMTYNLTLANIIPAISSFSVRVNSVSRTVNSVSVSGIKVLLSLASPVVYDDVITVAYTKPATNPLQTTAGGQAVTISAQSVTNNVDPVSPIYLNSSIENATPSRLEMTYNLTLANIIPATSSISVRVNSVSRTVNSVSISGTKVLLTLSSPVVYGDLITVAYTKPATNPLQTTAGGQAVTISAQSVTNNVDPVSPIYLNSSIENATPSRLEMTYNLTLDNIIPATSSFSVRVNSVSRTVNSVSISGTKVLLTLASPVVYDDVITVAYTKPATNPLQTTAGGQAITLSAQSVTNNVDPVSPIYLNSSIENATPSRLEMTYNLSLANIIPATSSFSVRVNSVSRTVNSVSVSGTKVLLTLASPVVYDDVITVAYTKPATNPLQTTAGGQAITISAQSVTNNVDPVSPIYLNSSIENATPSRLEMTYNLSLANIIPATSSFSVRVNSVSRTLNSVSVSGTKVLLTLASPVVYNDVITVAYTKPATKPLQTTAGGQAVTIPAQSVTNNVDPVSPIYLSSSIENATPSRLEMTYNLSLANIIPATSSFSVRVNSVSRTVNSVSVSGTKVLLTLASPVVYDDVITVAYTKPATNPLQTTAGGQAITISAQSVTNNVGAVAPIYLNSSIENATPSRLEMTYNLTLDNIIPATSSFSVRVNSVSRTVNSVSISGTKVLLTLASPVVYDDVITVAYTKPATNPLQTTAGGQAITISAQSVTNNVDPVSPIYLNSSIENATPSRLEMTYNLTLDNIIPATSSFSVRVNSVSRTLNSVSISGTKVLLTLASPVVYNDVITVAYTKPATNPLQTTAGGQAVTISAQSVTNNVDPVSPTYLNSSIENATPSKLEMIYNLTLANIVPAASAFTVTVNSFARTINAVVISGTKIFLTLSAPVVYGEIVSVAYTKPAINPLQSTSGGQVATFSAQNVTNNTVLPANISPTIGITSPNSNSTFTAPANITITANASDTDGTITIVEFFNGTIKLGSNTVSPYVFTWNNVVQGIYSITAVATDNSGAKTTSSAISVLVSGVITPPPDNLLPVVSISNPTKGNKFDAPVDIDIEVIASDPDGKITKVELFNGGEKIAELNSVPYSYVWKSVSAGTYQIKAIATDNSNGTTTSSIVKFTVAEKIKYDANSEIINLYPNPNKGNFTIEFLVPTENAKNEIIISDLTGHQVYHETISADVTTKQIILTNIRSGIYILTVISKEIIVTKKIIIK